MDIFCRSAVVDLFCGAGGLTHGFFKEGFRVLAGIDVDRSCKYAYERNNKARFLDEDVCNLSSDKLLRLFGDTEIRILVGCAPCQPFSTYTNCDRKKDGKWKLLYRFADLIRSSAPDVFFMENVPALKRFEKGKVLSDFLASAESAGYHVSAYDVYCPDYGIPQHRTRLVVFGSKRGAIRLVEPFCAPGEYRTVADAISGLPPLAAGEACERDPLHRAARLSPLNLERIRQSKPGGTWRDWGEGQRTECHRRPSGHSYPSVYGRMRWDEPAPTMTTLCYGYGNGRFGHPEQDRAISLREAATFQTFPDDYVFVPPGGKFQFRTLGRQIGNAVPVELGRAIAMSIMRHLQEKF